MYVRFQGRSRQERGAEHPREEFFIMMGNRFSVEVLPIGPNLKPDCVLGIVQVALEGLEDPASSRFSFEHLKIVITDSRTFHYSCLKVTFELKGVEPTFHPLGDILKIPSVSHSFEISYAPLEDRTEDKVQRLDVSRQVDRFKKAILESLAREIRTVQSRAVILSSLLTELEKPLEVASG